MRSLVAILLILPFTAAYAQFSQGNPFKAPPAYMHYAPDRTCDLQHVRVDIKIDYPNRTFTARSENTMSPLRDGLTEVKLNAGPSLEISRVTVDGRDAHFTRKDRDLLITTPPLRKGVKIVVVTEYKAVNSRGSSFGQGGGGFHWIQPRVNPPTPANPPAGAPRPRRERVEGVVDPKYRVGFWTQGEPDENSDWVVTWDYPNDLTTSETHCTVPADWEVVGNGALESNSLNSDKTERTFVWNMDLPHATYLLSLVGGPFDIVRDRWRGVPLMYVVPRGEGDYAPYTFSGTKDMLSFYSDTLDFKYPWPKYAQDAMFDFGGGMENVSATTMQENVLTDPRYGFRRGDSLISHEMAHQWFGDTVTCKDWGDTWLNESFATFMQMLYFEHSRGKDAYDQEVDNNMRAYFGEAQRYLRPISDKLYSNPNNMFDSHTYPKGGVVLHTLRREIGDAALFAGLHYYLATHQHTPVQASELCRSITEATGINVEPFFDQWIFKQGHPVLDYAWTWDDAGKQVVLTVKQTQDTSGGTPIYGIRAKVGLFSGSKIMRAPVVLNAPSQEFKMACDSKPDAVVLDPDHDFLRQIPAVHWSHDEQAEIVKYGPESGDRMLAMGMLLTGTPAQADIDLCVEAVKADKGLFPAFANIRPITALTGHPELRPFYEELLDSPSYDRRLAAASTLAEMPPAPSTIAKFRAQINDQAMVPVVSVSIHALEAWDPKGNVDVFTKALTIKSRGDQIKRAAKEALATAQK